MSDGKAPLRPLHGARVAIPEGWDDYSVFRFAPPDNKRVAGPPRVTAAAGAWLRPTLIVTKHVWVKKSFSPAFFDDANRASLAQLKGYRVLRVQELNNWEQAALLQDASFVEPATGAPMFERRLAIAGAATVVLATLTGIQGDVQALSETMGITVSDS